MRIPGVYFKFPVFSRINNFPEIPCFSEFLAPWQVTQQQHLALNPLQYTAYDTACMTLLQSVR